MTSLGAITENIALLALLDPKEPETKNHIPASFADQNHASRFTLPLEVEKQTATAFAILLANTDDCKKVGAVCVEQQSNERGLVIRTAINKGDQAYRKEAFFKIKNALTKASSASAEPPKQEDSLPDEIVSACQLRLLGRLHSRHALPSRKSGKPPTPPKLHDSLKLLARGLCSPEAKVYREQVDCLMRSFESLENLSSEDARSEPGMKILKDILRSVEVIVPLIDTQSIPKNAANSGHSIIKRLKKLNQYRHATRYLLYAARKFPIFQHLRIAEVSFGPFSERVAGAESSSTQRGIFSRSTASKPMVKQKNLVQLLVKRSGKNMQQIIKELKDYSNLKKRVHAEIKLLFHYERQTDKTLRPRVIVSNKHACFLCNLFLKVHGGFYTPSSHGNFYPAWRIPRPDEVSLPKETKGRILQCLDQFNSALEAKIRTLVAQERRSVPDAPESVVFSAYSPSVSSGIPAPTETGNAFAGNSQPNLSPIPPESQCEVEDTRSTHSPTPLAQPASSSCPYPPDQERLRPQSPQLTEQKLFSEPHILTPGIPLTCAISPGSSARFHTSRIHLELSYEQICSLSSCSASSVSVKTALVAPGPGERVDLVLQVEWLKFERMMMSSERLEQAVDIGLPWARKRMPDGILFGEHGLLLMKKGDVIALRASLPN
ncbi:hypothetical protein PRK78_004984 [Emydomyces testavorans]|uniref:Uncharacterized protein n=1 Tax=Emydomyces testavorans TaxID=2070801 RepID=A0AAF0DMI3_9EURO|nr:hypothetical protein PRK78_004984 [Emydomyces testavorans]